MTNAGLTRNVFILLSSHSMAYARVCIDTMLRNCIEPVRLHLVVDNFDEKEIFEEEAGRLEIPSQSSIEVIAKEEVAARLEERFPGKIGLRALHEGHPCWRKIIDPIVLSAAEDEIIVTDPDLFFPNRFSFEPTPQTGVMMMRQGPNCLYPPEAVRRVFELGVPLANHVDIGVAQLRAGAVDLDWLDWFIRELDVERFRPFMHIEAVVWSALAMQIGGEHLSPQAWRCWERGKFKRIAVALGLPGHLTMKLEPLDKVKCIHVSGPSKWWVLRGLETGSLREFHNARNGVTQGVSYIELTPSDYEREQRLKALARKMGFYKLTKKV